jgi:hypothetical protein
MATWLGSFSPEPTATVDFTVAVGSGLNDQVLIPAIP